MGAVASGKFKHFQNTDAGVGTTTLQHDADLFAHLVRCGTRVQPQDVDCAAGGVDKTLRHFDRRGLSSAIGTKEAKDLTCGNAKAQTINGGGGAIFFHHVVHGEGWAIG